jgi:hypothetical protein
MANRNGTSDCLTTIDWAMQQLEAQWTIKPQHKQARGEALLRLLRQVGEARFRKGLLDCIDQHQGNYCPTAGQIRACVPAKQESEWIAPEPLPESERVNVWAIVKEIAQKHDLSNGTTTRQSVADAWARWQHKHGMTKWTWNS